LGVPQQSTYRVRAIHVASGSIREDHEFRAYRFCVSMIQHRAIVSP
jgi:hypothetical protein